MRKLNPIIADSSGAWQTPAAGGLTRYARRRREYQRQRGNAHMRRVFGPDWRRLVSKIRIVD